MADKDAVIAALMARIEVLLAPDRYLVETERGLDGSGRGA